MTRAWASPSPTVGGGGARAAPELSVDKITTVQARAKRRATRAARRNADARRCGAVFIRRRTAAL
ncbi:conserved hypothetical protein [Burkholderia pseudomallei MSHR346]|nr:conserved hypothetical protein [Burkholderia pseudomallei MSHR346]